jgi:hypothetical protein
MKGAAMTCLRLLTRLSPVFTLAAALTVTAFAQVRVWEESIGGPLSGPPVLGAPFSADATTIVHAIFRDGTRLDQITTDRYYRDSAGRVRVERPMDGMPAPTTMSGRHMMTIIDPDPSHDCVNTMDAQTQTFRDFPRSLISNTAGGGRWLSIPLGGVRFLSFRRAGDLLSAYPGAFADVRDQPLGSQRIAGVATTGHRITVIVPPNYIRNDQPVEMTDERWESAELQLLVYSRHSDSRGTIEYRLSNIRRDEPPAHLFEIPPGYTKDFSSSDKDPQMASSSAETFHAK